MAKFLKSVLPIHCFITSCENSWNCTTFITIPLYSVFFFTIFVLFCLQLFIAVLLFSLCQNFCTNCRLLNHQFRKGTKRSKRKEQLFAKLHLQLDTKNISQNRLTAYDFHKSLIFIRFPLQLFHNLGFLLCVNYISDPKPTN